LNGNRLRFAWNSVRPVLDSNTADIEWMESRMGVSLKETLEDETDAIQCENDLFSYKTKELLWLAEQLGLDSSKSLPSHMLPEQVADLIDNLRNKLAENSENEGKIGTNKKRKDRTSNTGSSKQTRSSNIIEEIQNKEMVTSVKTNDTNMLSIDAIKEIYNKFWKPSYKSITPREAYFIQEGIIKCKPKRFLEIGTASGISTGLIATFLGLNSGNEVVTLDLRKTLWTDHTKETGFLAEEICKKDVIITHITEKNSAYLPEKYLDNKFDMAFIDASHQHPWPTLDMLAVLPLMKEGTFIYHHDLALFYNRNQTNARGIGPKYLFDQMPQSIRFVAPFGGKNIYYIITPGNYESLSGALIDALYLPWTLNNKIPEPNFMNYIDIAKKYWDNNVVEALEITFKRYNPAIA